MPYLDKRYIWDDLLREIDEDTECIIMDSLDEMMRNLEGEIIETMD